MYGTGVIFNDNMFLPHMIKKDNRFRNLTGTHRHIQTAW